MLPQFLFFSKLLSHVCEEKLLVRGCTNVNMEHDVSCNEEIVMVKSDT